VRETQAYDHALAIRSAIIMAIEPCVDNTPYPVWPEYMDEGEKFAFGWCLFPDRYLDEDKSLGAYIRTAAMTSLDDRTKPGLAIDHIVDAIHTNAEMLACNDQHDDTGQVSKRAGEINILTDAVPIEVPGTTTVYNTTKTMVWAGYVRTRMVPTYLRGAPDQCLIYRRIVKDLDDNNKVLDDTYTTLYTPVGLTRQLCDDPRKLEITILYCDHIQCDRGGRNGCTGS
jgi:hypothetical protein